MLKKSHLFWPLSSQLWWFLQALSAVTIFAQSSDGCAPAPLSLPIGNITVSSGHIRRGVSVNVGEPEDEFAFLPSWQVNNTFIYGPDCDDIRPKVKCSTFRGGLYYPDRSDAVGSLDSDFKSQPERWDSDTYKFSTDTVSFGENGTLKEFPLARPLDVSGWDLQGYNPQHMLGMQPGSTFLQALTDGGHIASRSWGFYWGLDGRGSREQSSGIFVLGGYDRAKTYGDGFTENLEENDGCPTGMLVVIRDMVLNFSNGTDASIFSKSSGGQGLLACIDPSVPVLMDLPQDPYFLNWQYATGYGLEAGRSTGVDYWNILLSEHEEYGFDGDLTFNFGSNFKITIPNNHLVVPDRTFNDKGEIYSNDTRSVLRINALQDINSRSLPRLGRYFLSLVHVLYNDGAKQFTLWEANPTSTTDLVAINEDGDKVDSSFCTGVPSSTPTAKRPPDSEETESSGNDSSEDDSSGDDSSEDDSSGDDSHKLSTGAIAGIAVGGVVAFLGVLCGLWFWWKRRSAKADQARSQQALAPRYFGDPSEAKPPVEDELGYPSQAYPHYIPQELSANQQPQEKRYEMPA